MVPRPRKPAIEVWCCFCRRSVWLALRRRGMAEDFVLPGDLRPIRHLRPPRRKWPRKRRHRRKHPIAYAATSWRLVFLNLRDSSSLSVTATAWGAIRGEIRRQQTDFNLIRNLYAVLGKNPLNAPGCRKLKYAVRPQIVLP